MAYADEQSYEEMIAALQTYLAELEEQCTAMEKACEDLVDNTDEDVNADEASNNLLGDVAKIRSAMETIEGIIGALQQQLDDIVSV